MFEADALCNRIAVINHGRIIALDTPGGLKTHVRDLNVVEVETFGAPESALEKLRALPFADSLSVEEQGQKQILLIQTGRGAEAVPDVMSALEGLKVGRVIVREPTLEDALCPLGGRQCMNVRLLAKYWRTILVVAEMNIRQQMTDGFILFTVLFQPIIIALLGLWMLKDKGADSAMFVVVGSGLTGLWSSLLFISGNSINFERWTGTLEVPGGTSHPVRGHCLWEESRERHSVSPLDGAWIYHRCICVRVFAGCSTTLSVCDLNRPGSDRLYQLWFDHRAHLCYESWCESLAKCHGISRICLMRISFPDRPAAWLDDAGFVSAPALLGRGRSARNFNRGRVL